MARFAFLFLACLAFAINGDAAKTAADPTSSDHPTNIPLKELKSVQGHNVALNLRHFVAYTLSIYDIRTSIHECSTMPYYGGRSCRGWHVRSVVDRDGTYLYVVAIVDNTVIIVHDAKGKGYQLNLADCEWEEGKPPAIDGKRMQCLGEKCLLSPSILLNPTTFMEIVSKVSIDQPNPKCDQFLERLSSHEAAANKNNFEQPHPVLHGLPMSISREVGEVIYRHKGSYMYTKKDDYLYWAKANELEHPVYVCPVPTEAEGVSELIINMPLPAGNTQPKPTDKEATQPFYGTSQLLVSWRILEENWKATVVSCMLFLILGYLITLY